MFHLAQDRRYIETDAVVLDKAVKRGGFLIKPDPDVRSPRVLCDVVQRFPDSQVEGCADQGCFAFTLRAVAFVKRRQRDWMAARAPRSSSTRGRRLSEHATS